MQDVSIKRSFVFNGETYTMGRLVLAIIKDFAATHNGTNMEALREAFPDSLMAEGTLHLVEDNSKITPKLEGRYFLKPVDLIPVMGATIAVSNRWHRLNIYNFLPHARALGYDITELHDGVPVGEAKNTSKPAPKNSKAAADKKEPKPAKASPKTAKQAPSKPPTEKTSTPPVAQSEAIDAPVWKDPGNFLTWLKEGDASSVVSQWAFMSANDVISSIGNVPLNETQMNSLVTYIYLTANVFATFERQAYHNWLIISTSPRPKVSEDGKKDYIDFLQLREDENLDERAQNAALKKLQVYTKSTAVESFSRDLLNIIVNLCMGECLAVTISVYNHYHLWLGDQTDFCLEYTPYKVYRTFLENNNAITQFQGLVEQNTRPMLETGQIDFLNQYQFEPLASIVEIITLSYMDSIAKDYHNWIAGDVVAKKTPQKAAEPKSENTAKSPKELFEEAERLQHGRGVPQDIDKAFDFYMQAAKADYPDAVFVMAEIFNKKGDYKNAADYYYNAARLGVSAAAEPLMLCGKRYQFGKGLEIDVNKAVDFYMKAADFGNINAAMSVGTIFSQNKKHEDALHYYKIAADAGSSEAMFMTGSLYYLLKDTESALRYFKMADAAGDTGAADMIKVISKSQTSSTGGYGAFDDKGKLFDINVPPGTVPPVGFIKGVAKQYAKGRRELDKGHQCLKNNDVAGAEKFWIKAASKGNFAAMCNLGNLYQHYYSPPMMDRAWHWYQQAAMGGVKEVEIYLKRVSGK